MYVKRPQVEEKFSVAAEFIPTSVKICGLGLEGQISLNLTLGKKKSNASRMTKEGERDTTDMPVSWETNTNHSFLDSS